MEEAQHQGGAGIVADRDPQHRPVTEAPIDGLHRALDLDGNPRLQSADRRDPGAVLVLAWQLQPQILERRQATSGQLFADLRPDALQDADRSLADRRQRGCGSVGAGHQSMARMASTSNVAAFGRDDTPIVERAGYGASKYSA